MYFDYHAKPAHLQSSTGGLANAYAFSNHLSHKELDHSRSKKLTRLRGGDSFRQRSAQSSSAPLHDLQHPTQDLGGDLFTTLAIDGYYYPRQPSPLLLQLFEDPQKQHSSVYCRSSPFLPTVIRPHPTLVPSLEPSSAEYLCCASAISTRHMKLLPVSLVSSLSASALPHDLPFPVETSPSSPEYSHTPPASPLCHVYTIPTYPLHETSAIQPRVITLSSVTTNLPFPIQMSPSSPNYYRTSPASPPPPQYCHLLSPI